MNASDEYQKWLHQPNLPQDLQKELRALEGNQEEIQDRFGQDLDFGTGGMRGVMGAGLNRMNVFTVRRASFACAKYLLSQDQNNASRGIVIGYDCRHMSPEFAQETALAFAALGVKAFVSPVLCPTPEVSFTVRHLKAAGGVMITASHNPPEYNGYKVYGPDGCQLLPYATNQIRTIMAQQEDVFEVEALPLDEAKQRGLLQPIPSDVRNVYVSSVVKEIQCASVSNDVRDAVSLVYTPLHGAGNVPVRAALQTGGYQHVTVVAEQEQPNGDFPTVKSPNPGDPESLTLGILLASRVEADIVLGTDPDSDRVGIAVRNNHGDFVHLTGNQVGALLMDFILSTRNAENRLPENGIVFKTIVTSELGGAIAKTYGIPTEDTLTGFKYIGSKITAYEQTGEHTFLLGYEESYGYLVSPIVRDKDAVQTCLVIAEMTAFHKRRGKTLWTVLHELYQRFGYYAELEASTALDEGSAQAEVKSLMAGFRQTAPDVRQLQLVAVEDYLSSARVEMTAQGRPKGETIKLDLPKSNVLKYWYHDGSWLAVRPSGTEPKIKFYYAARGNEASECKAKIADMQEAVQKHMNRFSK